MSNACDFPGMLLAKLTADTAENAPGAALPLS